MGTWGPGNFESDAALDFVNEEVDRHVAAIMAIFADEDRFRLDEDAEGELIPRIVLLTLLCVRCNGVLPEGVDVAAWKVRYLSMYDDQMDGLEPAEEYGPQRRAMVAAAFDELLHAVKRA